MVNQGPNTIFDNNSGLGYIKHFCLWCFFFSLQVEAQCR